MSRSLESHHHGNGWKEQTPDDQAQFHGRGEAQKLGLAPQGQQNHQETHSQDRSDSITVHWIHAQSLAGLGLRALEARVCSLANRANPHPGVFTSVR